MFRYNVTFSNGASSVVDSVHEITGMPKQSTEKKQQHYRLVIPAYVMDGEERRPYGDLNVFEEVKNLIASDEYWYTFLTYTGGNGGSGGRFMELLNIGSFSSVNVVTFEQKEGCDVDAANSRAEEILQLIGDEIVTNARAVGGTTFFYAEGWNQIYCVSEDNRWKYQAHQEELVYAQFGAMRNVDGMMTVDETMWHDFINRFNKHVGGPEPDFSEARFDSETEGQSYYGPVFVGQSFIDAAAYGGMTDYFQDDPTFYYHFDIFF